MAFLFGTAELLLGEVPVWSRDLALRLPLEKFGCGCVHLLPGSWRMLHRFLYCRRRRWLCLFSGEGVNLSVPLLVLVALNSVSCPCSSIIYLEDEERLRLSGWEAAVKREACPLNITINININNLLGYFPR